MFQVCHSKVKVPNAFQIENFWNLQLLGNFFNLVKEVIWNSETSAKPK